MNDDSVIVIGAGLAGLSAGCYAQMNGYDSHIFEHHRVPGGVAASWKRKGYLIDGGIHFIMGHRPGTSTFEMYRELGTGQVNRIVDIDEWVSLFDQSSGRHLTLSSNLAQMGVDLKEQFPHDARLIDDLVRNGLATRGMDWEAMGMSKPPELTTLVDVLRMGWSMRRHLRLFVGKNSRSMAEYAEQAHDPWLHWVLRQMFLPEVPAWFVFMLLGMLADGQLGLLEGGSLAFVLPIERRYKELGGKISYQATVEEILVEGDRAVGVRLADGSEHRSDVVISAADGYSTLYGMLNGRYLDEKAGRRYRDWPLIRPLVMISFGVERGFDDMAWTQIVKLEKPIAVGIRDVEEIMLRVFNYSDRFAPPGRTVVQVSLETEWDYWEQLHADAERYAAVKQRLADEALSRLSAMFPGIEAQVEMTDVATPYTTWRYTRNHRGAYMGWLPTPKTIMSMIPRTVPGLDSFLMAGQWVSPGGGVPTCLFSGRHAVQILCHRDGKAFRTELP